MKHPLHATDRCCRICYARNVTATPDVLERIAVYIEDPQEREDRRHKATQAAKVAALVETWLPGGGADWRYDQYDRARTRKGAGLARLHESTGERDG